MLWNQYGQAYHGQLRRIVALIGQLRYDDIDFITIANKASAIRAAISKRSIKHGTWSYKFCYDATMRKRYYDVIQDTLQIPKITRSRDADFIMITNKPIRSVINAITSNIIFGMMHQKNMQQHMDLKHTRHLLQPIHDLHVMDNEMLSSI